jgi:hypothetical protein
MVKCARCVGILVHNDISLFHSALARITFTSTHGRGVKGTVFDLPIPHSTFFFAPASELRDTHLISHFRIRRSLQESLHKEESAK